MEQTFSNFAELAAATVTERLRAARDADQSGSEPQAQPDRVIEATVQMTLRDGEIETVAYVTPIFDSCASLERADLSKTADNCRAIGFGVKNVVPQFL